MSEHRLRDADGSAGEKEAAPKLHVAQLPAIQPLTFVRRIVSRAMEKEPDARLDIPHPIAQVSRTPRFYLLSFILIVILPSLASILYLALIASDQYVAEARFAVRTTQIDFGQDKGKKDGELSSGSLPSLAGQDAYIVANYIRSRSIFRDLPGAVDPRVIFRRPGADFFARMKKDASIEEMIDYWRGMVTAYVDGPSGVVTINVRAFWPQDARDLANALVEASEKLANNLSARARHDAMARAEEEVRRTEGQVRQVLVEMRGYRDTQGFIDPASASASTSQLLLKSMGERIAIQNDYYVAVRSMGVDAPSVKTLASRLAGVDEQIEQLKRQMTARDKDAKTISAAIVRFEELEVKRIFAEKMYSFAQSALERARIRAERQNIYISVFVSPEMPEEARFPERLSLSLLIPLALLIVWGIGALIAASIEDHTY